MKGWPLPNIRPCLHMNNIWGILPWFFVIHLRLRLYTINSNVLLIIGVKTSTRRKFLHGWLTFVLYSIKYFWSQSHIFFCSPAMCNIILGLDIKWPKILHNFVKTGYIFHTVRRESKSSIPITGLERPWGFQEVEAPRFQDIRHTKVTRFQLYSPAAFTPMKYSWYSFLLEVESTPGS